MTTLLIIGLVLAGITLALIAWFISGYNGLVHSKALVDEAWSGMDVQLKRRFDLIPNLVATVKQYTTHEKGVFEEVTRMRSAVGSAQTMEQKVEAEKGLTGALKNLFAVAENYPQLKANENFMHLQKELTTLENEIQLSRRYYNGAARNYNIATTAFPSSIIASLFSFHRVPYFELGSTAERENPGVKF